jgi:GH24 family phage-related lysozyme (muramidase)
MATGLKIKPTIVDNAVFRLDTPARITTVSQNFIDLVVHFECSGNINNFLKAYKDSVGIPTIGIGTTFYPGGKRVAMGDTCTVAQAYEYFRHEVANVERKVDSYTRDDVSQGMFDALVDFGYNLGTGALQGSTLLKKVNANPTDFAVIEAEFQKWSKARNPKTGQLETLKGLLRRRNCEFYLYKNGKNIQGFLQ